MDVYELALLDYKRLRSLRKVALLHNCSYETIRQRVLIENQKEYKIAIKTKTAKQCEVCGKEHMGKTAMCPECKKYKVSAKIVCHNTPRRIIKLPTAPHPNLWQGGYYSISRMSAEIAYPYYSKACQDKCFFFCEELVGKKIGPFIHPGHCLKKDYFVTQDFSIGRMSQKMHFYRNRLCEKYSPHSHNVVVPIIVSAFFLLPSVNDLIIFMDMLEITVNFTPLFTSAIIGSLTNLQRASNPYTYFMVYTHPPEEKITVAYKAIWKEYRMYKNRIKEILNFTQFGLAHELFHASGNKKEHIKHFEDLEITRKVLLISRRLKKRVQEKKRDEERKKIRVHSGHWSSGR